MFTSDCILSYVIFINLLNLKLNVAKLGDYSEYIPNYKSCGISRKIFIQTDKCFDYQRQEINPIYSPRKADNGGAAWVVLLSNGCSGSLISEKWVLTAAHCLKEENHFQIYIGQNNYKTGKFYNSKSVIKHPRYKPAYNDIGLIELEDQIAIEDQGIFYSTNIICLPEANMPYHQMDEFGFVSGWGKRNSKNHTRLQIGVRLIKWSNGVKEYAVQTHRISGGNPICHGDSGAPIWRYENGKAIQIGVIAYWFGPPDDNCYFTFFNAMLVSDYMDWILQYIKS